MSNVVDEIIQYLVSHRRCPGCGQAYAPENIHVIDQPDRWTWDLAAVCHGCQTLTMVSALVEPAGRRPRVSGPATELTPAERHYFEALPALGSDDVLDLAEFLAAFDGDFRGLFSRGADDL